MCEVRDRMIDIKVYNISSRKLNYASSFMVEKFLEVIEILKIEARNI